MGQRDNSNVHVHETSFGVEFHTSSRNEHGTGYDLTVTVVDGGYVELLMSHIICGVEPDDPSLTLLLTMEQVSGILQCISGGASIAYQMQKRKECH